MTEIRRACRALGARPGFTAAVVATIALVIAGSVVVASLARGLFLRPLPFADGDRLAGIEARADGDAGKLSSREVRGITRDSRLLADVAAFYPSQYNVTGDGPPESLVTMIGTSNLFRVFGVRMLHGDTWPESLDWQRQYVVVIGHGLWQRRYGGDPAIVGRSIVLDGAPYTVAGVLPPGFDYPIKADLYRAVTNYTAPDARRFTVVARLAHQATWPAARTELETLASSLAEQYPDTNRGMRLELRPIRDVFVGAARPYLIVLALAMLVVVAIACANIGNLLLARALGRRTELAVRRALGANRWMLVRHLLAESLVLAAAGGALGLALGYWALGAGLAVAGQALPTWITVSVDWWVALVAATIALAVAAAVSLPAMLQAARGDLRPAIGTGARGGRRGERRVLALLAATQIAFAVVVLSGAVLMLRTMAGLVSVDPGFRPDGVLTFRVDPPWTGYGSTEAVAEFYRRAFERLAALPGVTAAASNMTLPFGGIPDVTPTVTIEGSAAPASAGEMPFVNFQAVSPGYFEVMGITLLAGRAFSADDRADTVPVAVVSRRAAERFWPDQDPIGRRLRTTWRTSGTGTAVDREVTLTVVGVVGDVRSRSLVELPALDLYASHHQTFAGDTFIVLRTEGDPSRLLTTLGPAVRDIDPDQSIFDVRMLEDRMAATIWQQRTTTMVMLALSLLAVVLAGLGIHSVLAYGVAQQQHELGIRRALGAADADLRALVLAQGMGPAAWGLAAGALASLATWRALDAIVVGAPAWDVASLAVPLLVATLMALVGCLLPARRALRVAPAEALRVV